MGLLKRNPLVSVIMPAYNAEEHIKEAIDSVLAQTYQDFEIVITDDGSKDNTSEKIRQYNDKRIHYLYQQNAKQAVARNNGIKHSKGEFIAFLDADDIWDKNKLELQLPLFENDESVGIVFSDMRYFDSNGLYQKTAFQYARPKRGNVNSDIFIQDFIPMSSVVLRRKCFDDVGFFDPILPPCEDHDLWLRITVNWKVDFIDEALVSYRFSKNQSHKNLERLHETFLIAQGKAFKNNKALQELDMQTLEIAFLNRYVVLFSVYLKKLKIIKAMICLIKYFKLNGTYLNLIKHFFPRLLKRWKQLQL